MSFFKALIIGVYASYGCTRLRLKNSSKCCEIFTKLPRMSTKYHETRFLWHALTEILMTSEPENRAPYFLSKLFCDSAAFQNLSSLSSIFLFLGVTFILSIKNAWRRARQHGTHYTKLLIPSSFQTSPMSKLIAKQSLKRKASKFADQINNKTDVDEDNVAFIPIERLEVSFFLTKNVFNLF